jgi:hypothetical protein
MWFGMRIDTLIIFSWLLFFLPSAGIIGCANSQQPTNSLAEWERARRAAGVGIGGG